MKILSVVRATADLPVIFHFMGSDSIGSSLAGFFGTISSSVSLYNLWGKWTWKYWQDRKKSLNKYAITIIRWRSFVVKKAVNLSLLKNSYSYYIRIFITNFNITKNV